MVEFWAMGSGVPVANARQAERAEAAGYDGLVYVDSQNLSGDCYVALALAARATTNLKLGTGVTNPFTRHPAVTASAIATIQAESDGRAHLGIGRGDSALAHLGLAPAPVRVLETCLERLQAYLRGDEVPFDPDATVDSLGFANQPAASRIEWLRDDQPKVPVDVAATGPRVIAVAARLADRVSFALGADPARIRWGIAVAREAREAAGLPPAMPFGAYIPLAVHDDPETAWRLGAGPLSLFARFSVLHGRVVGPASDEQRATLSRVHDAYDMTSHGGAGSPQAQALTSEFAGGFGIFGPPELCIDRLTALVRLGLDRIVVVGPGPLWERDPEVARAGRRFVEEVMPAVRAGQM